MKLLCFESTAKAASVALLEDSRLLGELYVNNGLTHSQTLLPMAQAVLENTKITGQELDCIAVAAGPGSFTGVRIGIAAVKGLAMALDKPCAPVSTLAAMAALMPYRAGTVCAVMDARCAQVYNALFALQDGKIQRLTPDRAVPVAQLRDELAAYPGPIFLVGDGAELCYNELKLDVPGLILTPEHLRMQRAYGVGIAAQQGDVERVTAQELLPVYLRMPQAQRELKRRQAGGLE